MTGNNTRAVIWDMDGVIADTAPYHFSAWRETWRKRGVDFTEEDFSRSFGLKNDNIIRNILGEATSQSEIDTIAADKEEDFRGRVKKDNITALPGAVELMKSLNERGFKLALASSTPIENIRLLFQSLGIGTYFSAIVAGDDVKEGKPSPQCFLLAARRLEVEPVKCIVIEDAVAGVAAAKRAGMRCLAVTTTHPRASLTEADLTVDTLATVTANDMERLLSAS
jgi:beta-phosphoglucomutase family hydrolase